LEPNYQLQKSFNQIIVHKKFFREKKMKAKGLMSEFWGEVFGTFVLVLLGDGVVANVGLAPRLAAPAVLLGKKFCPSS
jgi:hypothetical protein